MWSTFSTFFCRGREGDLSKKTDVYVMTDMIFGSTYYWPSTAHYVKNINAEELQSDFPRAVEAMKTSHNVDDMLGCARTVDTAVKLARMFNIFIVSQVLS